MIRKISTLAVAAIAAGLVPAPGASAESVTVCPSELSGVATADTSCGFADNVRAAWIARPEAVVYAFSPVTQQSYTMNCSATATDLWPNGQRCSGVNTFGVNLVVYFLPPSAPGSGSQSSTATQQPMNTYPGGVDADADADLPYVNSPNIGCTWVNSYTKSNGTRVSGYWRC